MNSATPAAVADNPMIVIIFSRRLKHFVQYFLPPERRTRCVLHVVAPQWVHIAEH